MIKDAGTDENQGGVEILVVFLHVFCIVVRRLPFVHCVEVELRVVVLDRLEIHPQGLLDAKLCDVSLMVRLFVIDSAEHTIEGRR